MIVQLVEGVEELLLRALLVAEKLDIVDQQDVGLAVALVKLRMRSVRMQAIISFMKRSLEV
jgi:hypothetical protein